MLDPTQIDRIEAYHKGRLSPTSKAKIQDEMQNDPVLLEEVEIYGDIFDGFAALEAEHCVQQVATFEKKYQKHDITLSYSDPNKKRQTGTMITLFKKYGVAAILLLLAIPLSIVLFQMNGNGMNSDSLYAEGFSIATPPLYWTGNRESPDVSELMGDPDETDPDADPASDEIEVISGEKLSAEELKAKAVLSSGVNAYNKKDYTNAIKIFKEYLKEKPSNRKVFAQANEIKFYMAVAHMANNDFAQAEALLKELTKANNTMQQNAEWYLALNMLKKGEIKPAKKAFKKISKKGESHPFATKATVLLEKMEKNNL